MPEKIHPTYFKDQRDFRKWLHQAHEKAVELWVGYHKKSSGLASITWPDSVDVALCYGWIDGIRKSVDENSYTIRFTPRRSSSTWSLKNINRFKELQKEGLVHPAGLAAYRNRKEDRSGIYSFEQKEIILIEPYRETFKQNHDAWDFFLSQPPSYRKPAIHWVMSAKREDTRRRRLEILISDSASGIKIKPLRRNK